MNSNVILTLLVGWPPKGWATSLALAAFGLLTTCFAIDSQLHDRADSAEIETAWLSLKAYGAIAAGIVTIGGAGMRRAMDSMAGAKPEPPQG